jgi:hypothetical protein
MGRAPKAGRRQPTPSQGPGPSTLMARGRGHATSKQLCLLRAGQQIPRKQCSDNMAWALGLLGTRAVKHTLAPQVPASTGDCCEMHAESAEGTVEAELNWAPPSQGQRRAVQLQPRATGATRRMGPSVPAGGRDPKQMRTGMAWAPGFQRAPSVRQALSPHVPASAQECATHAVFAKRNVKAGLHLGSPNWQVGGQVVLLQPAACTTVSKGPFNPTRENIPIKHVQTNKAEAHLKECV